MGKKERQRVFLVDLENYLHRLANYIDVRPNDVIIYFCTQDHINTRVRSKEPDAKYIITGNTGGNVSDYAMFFHLGYIVRTYCRNADYYVISNDNIFYNLIGVALDMGYNTIQCKHVHGAIYDLGYNVNIQEKFTSEECNILGSSRTMEDIIDKCKDNPNIKQNTVRYMIDLTVNRRIF